MNAGFASGGAETISLDVAGVLLRYSTEEGDPVSGLPRREVERVAYDDPQPCVMGVDNKGENVALGFHDGAVWIRDLASGHRKLATVHSSMVMAISFSRDGKYLATGDQWGHVHILSLPSCRKVISHKCHQAMVKTLSWRSDGEVLLSHGYEEVLDRPDLDDVFAGHAISRVREKSTVRLWRVSDELTQIRAISGESRVDLAAFGSDEDYVVTGDWAGRLTIWDVSRGAIVRQWQAHSEWIEGLAILGKTGCCISGGRRDGGYQLAVWDMRYGRMVDCAKVPFPPPIWELAADPSGKMIVVGGTGWISLWKFEGLRSEKTEK